MNPGLTQRMFWPVIGLEVAVSPSSGHGEVRGISGKDCHVWFLNISHIIWNEKSTCFGRTRWEVMMLVAIETIL